AAQSPVAVAGMSFADISDGVSAGGHTSRPMLFLTTADGQVMALNARAFDAGAPPAGGIVWRAQEPVSPNGGSQVYEIGAAPLVAKIALYGKYQATPGDAATETLNMLPRLPQSTITKAQQKGTDEWLMITNRDDGRVFAHAAAGDGQGNRKLRWTQDVTAKGGQPETFVSPPIVMDGGTPQPDTFQQQDANAYLGSTDPASSRPDHEFGYDDVVVCAGVDGRIFGIDALGNIH